MSRRIETSNIEDFIKGKILDNAVDKLPQDTRIFYYGIVINNIDPKNANRVQIRIPLLDDNFYVGKTKEQGNAILPWCLPMNRNFINTPENNSIVLVGILDPKIPYFGRIFFDTLTTLTDKDIFDFTRLLPETGTYNNWQNAELAINAILNSKPKIPNQYNSKENVNYNIGIRGKGSNRLLLTKDAIELYQNEKSKTESYLRITNNIVMETSNNMDLVSKKGGTKYHPVFDKPLHDYLTEMNNMIKEIVMMLASKPSTNSSTMAPNLPSPSIPNLIGKLANMFGKFNNYKQPGVSASKYLFIN